MHVLDSKICEIEGRIEEVIQYAPMQEGITMQETVLSYGWILLDSWIAWRTLRFLLKRVSTIQNVQEKWLQTPSSYTSAQVGAVWGFTDITSLYLTDRVGRDAKGIFNDLIQKKRNASAHCATKTVDPDTQITGGDNSKIQLLYKGLSHVFLFYETKAFWEDVHVILTKKGYGQLQFSFPPYSPENEVIDISLLESALPFFDKERGYKVTMLTPEDERYEIKVEGKYSKISMVSSENSRELVLKNSENKYYNCKRLISGWIPSLH